MGPSIVIYDVGTSSLKAVVYDGNGRVLGKKSRFYEFSTPKDGWAEIDPEVWWQALLVVTDELAEDGIDFSRIEGIAVTGQMHSAVLLGNSDEVLGPSILWLDRRAAAETLELQDRFSLKPYVLNSSYTLPKLYWLSKNNPDMTARVKTILWPKDYLRFRMTGVKVTDYTEGIGSALIDWESRKWIPERIGVCGMQADVLPEIRPQEDMFTIRDDTAARLRLPRGCRVLVGCGDIAALLGGAPHREGRLVYSLGSSSMYFTEKDFTRGEGNGLYSLNIGGYKLFGGVSSTTGAALNWAYENIWGGEKVLSFKDMIREVTAVESNGDSVIFLPFLAGERSPFWSDSISGSFDGLKLHHDKRHLTKAVMDGVAFSIRYVIDLMDNLDIVIDEIALAGGGAKTEGWPQLIASATGKKVAVFNTEETVTTVLYAIMASILYPGTFREKLAGTFSDPELIAPDDGTALMYTGLYQRYRRVLDLKLTDTRPMAGQDTKNYY